MRISDWSSDVCSSDLAKLEDLFLGHYRDTDFRLVEARLHRTRGSGRRARRPVFAGLLCDVSLPGPFEAVVLPVGDPGTRGDWSDGNMQHNFPARAAATTDKPPLTHTHPHPHHHPPTTTRPT